MPRAKKDSHPFSIRMESYTYERLIRYCELSGQSKTIFNSSDLYREDILFESMNKENLELIKELVPYGIKVKVKQEYVNKEAIAKYFGISSCRYAYIDIGNITVSKKRN